FEVKYLWSGWTMVDDLSSTGSTIVSSYIWGPDFSDAQGAAGGAGALLGQYNSSGTLTYAVPDVPGSIVGYLNTSGNFVSAREFSPTGEQINSFGSSAADYPIGYAGQYTDFETGLIYYGYRYYNPRHGRFINRDPIEEAGGNNLFAFVGNAPTRGWDVLGLCFFSDGRWWGCPRIFRWDVWFGIPSVSPSEPPPPPPLIGTGTLTPPDLGNLGWERSPWRFDPRETAKPLVGNPLSNI